MRLISRRSTRQAADVTRRLGTLFCRLQVFWHVMLFAGDPNYASRDCFLNQEEAFKACLPVGCLFMGKTPVSGCGRVLVLAKQLHE